MSRLSGWPATAVDLVSVTLDMEQPSVAQVQEACNLALAHGARADSLSLAVKNSLLRVAGPKGASTQNPLDLARRRCRGDAPHGLCMADPQFSPRRGENR